MVRAKSLDPPEAERIFRLELEKNSDPAAAHFGLGIALKERADYEQAVTHLLRSLELLPANIPVLRCLAETYQFAGQNLKAVEVLEGVLKENPRDRASLYLVGLSYQNMEEYYEAARIYERLALMAPVKDQVFYNLGIVYGRQDKLGQAHFNFGIYFKKLKQRKEAEFHFKKAEEFSEKDRQLIKKIKKEQAELSKDRDL